MLPASDLVSELKLPSDLYLPCSQCGITFAWTGWEQSQSRSQPDLCPGCRRLQQLTRRQRGAVKWYDAHKGFGFVTTADGAEVFVHRASLTNVRGLRRGQVVAFRLEQGSMGWQAVDVERLRQIEAETEHE